MSCCIWMGWFPAFNETVTQLQMSYLPLISRAHSAASIFTMATASCHDVHSDTWLSQWISGLIIRSDLHADPLQYSRDVNFCFWHENASESVNLYRGSESVRLCSAHPSTLSPSCHSLWIFIFLFSTSSEGLWEHSWMCTLSNYPELF